MTFKQILKEFDEKFTYLGRNQIDQQEIILKPYTTPEDIKSFLKQSFIKYLQGEVKIIKEMEEDFSVNRHQVSGEVKKTQMLSKEKIIERLQAQIKELESIKN